MEYSIKTEQTAKHLIVLSPSHFATNRKVRSSDQRGGIVPYDEVWRAGANNATTVSFNTEVKIGNMPLDSAAYIFFIIPKEDQKWVAIFKKVVKQWGVFKYDEAKDALRVELKPRRTSFYTEDLTYTINELGHLYGSLILSWEYLQLEVPFETN